MVYIVEKPSLTRTRFASFTSNGPTLGLGLMAQYIFNRDKLFSGLCVFAYVLLYSQGLSLL
jgi:hypothetical protein